MLGNLLAVAVSTVEQYFPAMLSICFAGVTPEHAIAKARGEKIDDAPINKIIAEAISAEPLLNANVAPSPVLSSWAKELANAISVQADANTWRMVGHGAIVVHDDMERACNMLRRVADEAGMRFVRIASDDVMNIPMDLVDSFFSAAPILVYLEPSDWLNRLDKNADSEQTNKIRKFRKALTTRMTSFDAEHPVIYTTSTDKLGNVSPVLRKRDLFDRYFHIPNLSPDMLGTEFINLFGWENCDASITEFPGKVGKLLGDEFDNEHLRHLAALNMSRLAECENRKLAFIDLVDMVMAELGNSDIAVRDDEAVLRHTAIHEAGHAAMAVIDSHGMNTPEYSTIVARKDAKGMVVESIAYSFSRGDQVTYANFRHKIRISLAGRAAEEVAFGFDGISDGSRSDLENCVQLSSRAFACWGFAPNMNDAKTSGSNLAVILGEPSPSEMLHNETLTRKFLASEYAIAVKILSENRALLDAIADRLMRDSVLNQGEIAELYAAHITVPLCDSHNRKQDLNKEKMEVTNGY
jgi:ATP-dependent Zn protease